MTELVTIEAGNADEVLDLEKAKEVGDTLCRHYPNHPWMVAFQGRVLIVRHMDINEVVRLEMGKDGFGFVLPHLTKSAKALAHAAMLAGGQMLEAFGLPRGSYDGRKPELPSNWKRGTQRLQ